MLTVQRNHRRTTLCAGDAPVVDLNSVRTSCNEIAVTLDGLAVLMDDPAKAAITSASNKIRTTLAGLPTDVNSPALITQMLALVQQAQETVQNLAASVRESSNTLRTTRAGLPTEIANAVKSQLDAKVAAGELITKADHEAKVNAAKTAALSDIQAQASKISGRRTQLASLNIPVPADDSVLGGDDAAFTARHTDAKERAGKLERFKLGKDRLTTLCWGSKDLFETAFGALEEAVKPGANGFAAGSGSGSGSAPVVEEQFADAAIA